MHLWRPCVVVRVWWWVVASGVVGPSKLSRGFSSARRPIPDALGSRSVVSWTASVEPVFFDTLRLSLLQESSTTGIRVHRRGSDPFILPRRGSAHSQFVFSLCLYRPSSTRTPRSCLSGSSLACLNRNFNENSKDIHRR